MTDSLLDPLELCDDQDRRWAAGERPTAEDYLARRPGLAADPEAVLDLIMNEVRLREAAGERPAREEYAARFPHLATQLGDEFLIHEAIERGTRPWDAREGGPTPPADPTPPPRDPAIPGYRIRGRIGGGAMGDVYRARDLRLNRVVAVKLLKDKYRPDSPAGRRFLEEAHITAQLQHPGIPPVHELGHLADGRPFLAMKLIRGRTLDRLLVEGTAGRGRLLAAFEQICQAVGYAHDRGVVHRDLKPHNVMVGAFGEVQVMDWGLAKVLSDVRPELTEPDKPETTVYDPREDTDEGLCTRAGAVLGTPAFMSPEQAIGAVDQIDERSDVFGLGGILCAILTGEPPFAADTSESARQLAARGQLGDAFARLDTCGAEPELVALCKRCLSPEKADRPRNAGEVAAAVAGLRAAAEDRARTAEREKAAADARAQEQRRKRRWQFAAAGVLVLALAGGVLGLGVYLRVQSKANVDLATKNAELEAAAERERQRFNLAVDAIGLFTDDVSKDLLLKEKEFKGLRNKLLKGAEGFYGKLEAQLKDHDDPASRAALGRAYHDLGELNSRLGRPDAAAVLRKALAVRQELADRSGATAEAHLDVGRTLALLAGSLQLAQDQADAAAAAGEALKAAERAEALAGPTVATAEVRGDAHYVLVRVFLSRSRLAEAREEIDRGIAARRAVVDARANDPVALAKLSRLYNGLYAVTALQSGEAAALPHLREAIALAARAAAADPDNPDHGRDLLICQQNMTRSYFLTDRLPEALAEAESGLRAVRDLAAAFPTVKDLQSLVAPNLYLYGLILTNLDRPVDAEAAFRESIDLNTALIAAGYTKDESRLTLSPGYLHLGNRYLAAGRTAEAAKLIRQAIATGEPNKRHLDLYQLGSCYAALSGLAGVEGSGVPAADGPAHTQKAVELLRQAVKGGFRARMLAAHDPGYLVLKDRPEFQKLLAEIEALNKAEAAKDK